MWSFSSVGNIRHRYVVGKKSFFSTVNPGKSICFEIKHRGANNIQWCIEEKPANKKNVLGEKTAGKMFFKLSKFWAEVPRNIYARYRGL